MSIHITVTSGAEVDGLTIDDELITRFYNGRSDANLVNAMAEGVYGVLFSHILEESSLSASAVGQELDNHVTRST